MENDRILLAALLFILLIVGANALMYGVVRSFTRGGKANWMNALRKTFDKPLKGSVNQSMDELHKKVEELRKSHEQKQE